MASRGTLVVMRIVVLVEHWPGVGGGELEVAQVAGAIRHAWLEWAPADAVEVFAVGDGGPRTADALAFEASQPTADAMVAPASAVGPGVTMLRPANQHRRWEPTHLAAAVTGTAATGSGATIVVPLGDAPPAGDATELWVGDVEAMVESLRGVPLVALVSSDRPLLGLAGMSAAVRDGRESDHALALAAQEQERRWGEIAHRVDRLAHRGMLIGSSALSAQPGSGAAGGLAYALAAVGARLTPAAPYLADLTGAALAAETADVVVAVTGALVPRTLDHGLTATAGVLAGRTGVPCVVLAPSIGVGRRDLMAAGVVAAHEAVAGDVGVRDGVRRVAQTWSPRR